MTRRIDVGAPLDVMVSSRSLPSNHMSTLAAHRRQSNAALPPSPPRGSLSNLEIFQNVFPFGCKGYPSTRLVETIILVCETPPPSKGLPVYTGPTRDCAPLTVHRACMNDSDRLAPCLLAPIRSVGMHSAYTSSVRDVEVV